MDTNSFGQPDVVGYGGIDNMLAARSGLNIVCSRIGFFVICKVTNDSEVSGLRRSKYLACIWSSFPKAA